MINLEIRIGRASIDWNVVDLIDGGDVEWRTFKKLRRDDRNGVLCASNAFKDDGIIPVQ